MSGIGATDLAEAKDGRDEPQPRGEAERGAPTPGLAPAPSTETGRSLRKLSLEAETRWFAGQWMEAIPLVAEIIRLGPLNARAHRDLGVTYLCCGRCGEAAASLRRAVELEPTDEDALGYLVEALERQGREAEALEVCRALRRSAQDEADRRYYAVKALMKEGRTGEAERELQSLATLTPRRANSVHRIGKLLSDLGRFEDAERLLARGVEETPTTFPALADIKRMKEEDRPLLQRMEAALDRPNLQALARLAIHFGLGKAYDDLGEYAKAIGHYDAGNRLRALSVRFNRRACAARVDHTIRSFTAETLDRAAPLLARPVRAEDDLPVLIVGMPRSGTTLVEQILSSHPAVAPGGELSFWGDRLAAWQAAGVIPIRKDAMSEVADGYLAHLRGLGPKALRVTDKMPRNFELLWLVRLALPHARIIHCRRHAIDTCLSNYFTNFWAGHEYAWDRGDLVFYYRQYERLMQHWRRVLPPDRFIEIDYEALVVDREAQTRRLVAFSGLDWNDACLAPERNARLVKTASRWQARQPVYSTSMERWRRYEPWLGALRALAPVERG